VKRRRGRCGRAEVRAPGLARARSVPRRCQESDQVDDLSAAFVLGSGGLLRDLHDVFAARALLPREREQALGL
jgi:hypothetical protein